RLSLSDRDCEDSPSCVLRLLLALSSNLAALFIRWVVFVFSFLDCFCFCLLSDCHLLPGCCFCLDPDGPDETQQFAAHRSDDLSLVFACRRQLAVALGQPR